MSAPTVPGEERATGTAAQPADADGASLPSVRRSWLRRIAFVVSPEDQPRWARPVLVAVTAVSAFLYAWRSSGYLEIYYAAAVRSMSMSWHNFLYAAFDPSGTVTTDKLPGAFWVQALSVRLFGLHDWAIVLPQIIEGALTVLVLYRVVRRLAGPVAAITAALVLALAPANVALNRGNVSDTLMILLVVLAADAIVSAIVKAQMWNVLLAGLWIGLAFQAKMIEAWLILPGLAIIYLIAAPGRIPRRVLAVGALGMVTVAVSLSWMLFVTAQPKDGRPYVDGSTSDSVFQQVFDYNGFGRIDQPSPNAVLFKTIGIGGLPATAPGWNRMLAGPFGEDTGWLIPAAAVVLCCGLLARRRERRDDLLRASMLLWGTWLAALIIVFSVSTTINSYYTAALTPAIGGLIGTGVAMAWQHRRTALLRLIGAATVVGSALYAAWLLPSAGTGLPGWLGTTVLAFGLSVGAVLVASIWVHAGRMVAGALALGLGAVLIAPTVASASVVSNGLGSFDTPFEPAAIANGTKLLFGPTTRVTAQALLPQLERLRSQFHTKDLMATQTAVLAAPTIFESGIEVYPLGGYDGGGSVPTLGHLKFLIAHHYFHVVLASLSSHDARYAWVRHHCFAVKGAVSLRGIGTYFCGTVTG
jgi:4-amino-4-deoxy-L-arabinose transferase-like glycosyltransferase